jgi:hypothetical protein
VHVCMRACMCVCVCVCVCERERERELMKAEVVEVKVVHA